MVIDLMRGAALVFAALLVVLPAHAQSGGGLADPTRPAAAYLPGGVAEAGVPTIAPLSRLTSVKLPHRGAVPSAVIDGQLVRLGERVGEDKLVKVNETSVVLEGKEGRETLYLIPDVTKTPAVKRTTNRPSAKEKR